MYERKAEKLTIIKIIKELIEEGRYKEQVRQRKENISTKTKMLN